MRFRRVPGQTADEVPEGSGADSRQGSGEFRGRKLMRFRHEKFRRVPAGMADEVLEGSGAGRQQSSGGLSQMADEVPKGCGAVSTQVCGGFRCRWLMKFWRVRVQIATKVPEGSDADR